MRRWYASPARAPSTTEPTTRSVRFMRSLERQRSKRVRRGGGRPRRP
jgi:hypothetical protein